MFSFLKKLRENWQNRPRVNVGFGPIQYYYPKYDIDRIPPQPWIVDVFVNDQHVGQLYNDFGYIPKYWNIDFDLRKRYDIPAIETECIMVMEAYVRDSIKAYFRQESLGNA